MSYCIQPSAPATLVELLQLRAGQQADRRAFAFVVEGRTVTDELTYAALDRRARSIAAHLREAYAPGERLLLLYPPGLEYIAAFFGCLYAGMVAVPAYPPNARSLPRVAATARDARPVAVLTSSAAAARLRGLLDQEPVLRALACLSTDVIPETLADTWRAPDLRGDSLAFLQYTSGSTADPRGVMVSHANLLHNQRLMQRAFGHEEAVGVGWLPLYHDMGLIGNVLQSVYLGAPCVLMSPLEFLRQPAVWLRAISHFRATLSGGPNFAYDLCARKISEEQRRDLDLRSWQLAFSGAEPVRADTLERFAQTFAANNFRRTAFYPCYGLAEATLFVTGGPRQGGATIRHFDAASLEREQRAVPSAAGVGRALVGCGTAPTDQQVLIVDPETRVRRPVGAVGEIWVGGPSVAGGYWMKSDETGRVFEARLSDSDAGPFLRTGDLGFWDEGQLFVAGRLKDLIIVRGRNVFPQDVEASVERSHPALRPGGAAAFGIDVLGEERLVVVQEVERGERAPDVDTLAAAIRQQVATELELAVHAVALIPAGSLPRTTSGKVQRRLCRERLLAGGLPLLGRSVLEPAAADALLGTPEDAAPSAADLLTLPPDAARRDLAAYLRALAARALQVELGRLDADRPVSGLGLDSVAVVELGSRVERELGVPVPLELFFGQRTFDDLGGDLLDLLRVAAADSGPACCSEPVPPLEDDAEGTRLSFAQERLWVLDQLAEEEAAYNIPVVVRLTGALDPEGLEWSLGQVVQRHAALRTTIVEGPDGPRQVVSAATPAHLPMLDLSHLSPEDRASRAAELTQGLARQSFDLTHGPLWRASLLRIDSNTHELVLVIHHVVADGWSVGVVVRELATLYAAHANGQPCPLTEPPLQYADYARQQRQALQGPLRERQLAYWTQQLGGDLPVLDLPTDRPRPHVQTYAGARQDLTLEPPLVRAVRDLGKREGATPFMVLLAAFSVLMHRLSGQDDIIVGSPLANRGRPELRGVVGPLLNTVALRTNLADRPSFREVLRRVRQAAVGAFANQDVAFEDVLEVLQPARDPSRTPVFQVFFNMLNFGSLRAEEAGAGLMLEALPVLDVGSKFDLTLYVADRGDELALVLAYNAELFDAPRMAELVAQYRLVLEQVCADPSVDVLQPHLVTERARACLPSPAQPLGAEWHGAIHDVFAMRAAAAPDCLAVRDARDCWTYGELESRSNQLAHYLRARGIRAGHVVAIHAHRGAGLPWAVLAALKAGAVFAILDPQLPVQRLVDFVRLARPRGWVQLAAAGEPAPELLACLDELGCTSRITLPSGGPADTQGFLADAPAYPLGVPIEPDDPACLVFTSGSTGQPKAVLGRHGGLTHFLPGLTRKYGLSAHDRFSMLSGLGHDPLQRDIFTALWVGAELHIPDPARMAAPGYLAAWLRERAITVANLTPAMGSLIATSASDAEVAESPLGHLRWAFFIGERLTWQGVGGLRRLAPRVGVVNLYGATETQRALAEYVVPADASADRLKPIVPLGRGLPDSQLLILNPADRQAGVGELGEICVRSPHLALGYVGDPTLTAERFVPNPLGGPGDRLYRTGDLGRYLPDGDVEFVARADRQVQVRGFRVEPAEVEAALLRCGLVREALVVARDNGPQGSTHLVAYVVPTADAGAQTELARALRARLQKTLPDYMLPAAYVPLAGLPLTTNGKVDLSRLPAARAMAPAAAEPRTPLELRLAHIWAELLGLDQVDTRQSFFELGGHSLLATQLVARIRRELGVELPLRQLFETPTLETLAAAIADLDPASDAALALPAVRPAPTERFAPFPLNEIQQAYWVGRHGAFQIGTVGSHAYWEIDADGLDLERLSTAWQRLVERHDMLRAVVLEDGRQRVLESVPAYHVQVQDLRGWPAQASAAELLATRERMSHRVFSGHEWPLFEICASRLDDERTRLHISFDFLIADASSWGVLGPELTRLYHTPDQPLPPLELTFRDYVLAEAAISETPALARALAYWRGRLASLPPAPDLPLARDPATLARPRFARRAARIEPHAWRTLKSRAARLNLTPTGLLLAAFSDVLATWSKSPRFTLNLTLFNRLPLHPQVNDIVGDFTSLTLLEVDHAAEAPFGVRAARLQQRLWQDLDHRAAGGVRVLRELARSAGRPAASMPIVFTSKLGIRDLGQHAQALAWLGTRGFGITQTPQVWLDHQVSEEEGSGALLFNWDAVDDLFPAGMLDAMFAAYTRLLERLAEDESVWRQATLELIPAEQVATRRAVNATAAPVPEGLLDGPFVAQAARQPHQTAVISSSRSLTYADLATHASRLGRWLRQAGARPNTLVGVVMDKGWEQAVAVFGIVQSGAAYLPIDAGLPPARVENLLEAGEVSLVVTQSWVDQRLEWPAGIRRICVDTYDLSDLPAEPLAPVHAPEDLAYVIFTSGSTGQPQGVMIDHRGALNTVVDVNQRFRVGPDDRVLGISALSFDLSVYDLFGVLGAGGTLVLPGPADARDPSRWAALMRREQVTVWNSVPALMKMLTDYLAERGEALPPSLRLALLSGDWIPVDLPARIAALGPRVEVVSLGGATEASIWSILHAIDHVDPAWSSIPYGRPMANQTFHVLNADLEPRPDWTPGDLFIGGIGLARGYWRNPAKTAARFVVHPRTGQRLYRTGDLGRYLPDGEIEFLGREDFQVKIQGYRIELGEIETALRQHPAVDAAVVSAAGDPRTGRRLVGYIVPRGTRSDDADGALGGELADYLRARLPDYMVPTAFVTLDALPLSANGKVDRKALPEPRPPRSARPPSDPAALPAVHRRVLEILGEVLEQDSLSLEDNFFDLGGSSLSAINAHAKLCHAFGRDLPVTLLFQHATIHDLAEHIDREVAAGDGRPVAGVRRTRDYGALRRTTLQRRAARRGTRKEDTL